MTPPPPIATAARQPVQERSRRAAAAILAAAEERFATDGFERTSVRSIATTAGVPVGSIYQFFANKQGVLDALAAEHRASLDRIFVELAESDEVGTLDDMVGLVVGRVVALAADQPSFRSAFAGPSTAGPFAEAGAGLRALLAERISGALLAANPTGGEHYRTAGAVCTEIARGLLPAVVAADGSVDSAMQAEFVVVLRSYLAEVKQRLT